MAQVFGLSLCFCDLVSGVEILMPRAFLQLGHVNHGYTHATGLEAIGLEAACWRLNRANDLLLAWVFV